MTLAVYEGGAGREAGTPLYRQPPHNIELEQALIGCLLLNNETVARLPDYLKAEHFFAPLHRRLYESIVLAKARDQLATPLTLKTQFESDPDFREAGGFNYLVRLVEDVPSVRNVDQFAKAIFDLATRRELIGVGEAIVNDAYDAPLDYTPQEQVEAAEKALYALAEPAKRGGGMKSFRAAASVALAAAETAKRNGGRVTGVSSGLVDMDKKLGGFQRSDLIVLAGRPGMGKTALGLNVAVNAARNKLNGGEVGAVVAFFSLEMSAEQLATRVLSEDSRISGWHIRHGKIDNNQFPALIDSVARLEELPLYIDDSPGLSISQVAARCRRMKRDPKIGLGLIVIDYLQLLEATPGKRLDNRVQEITDITKNLKGLAKELDVPVIALSQLNRGVDSRDDRRPVLSDLRESGSIEQDADVVMFVYREEYYLRTRKPDGSDAKKYAEWEEKLAHTRPARRRSSSRSTATARPAWSTSPSPASSAASAASPKKTSCPNGGADGRDAARPPCPCVATPLVSQVPMPVPAPFPPSQAAPEPTARVTVDLAAVAANRALIAEAAPGAEIGAAVKADGYGLGAVPVARHLAARGVRSFFVATPVEGAALREALGRPPRIFVLNGLPPGASAFLRGHKLIPFSIRSRKFVIGLENPVTRPAPCSSTRAWAAQGFRRSRRTR